jgi:preprotein translocase subunit SecA
MARELERINPERYYLYRDAVDAFLKHVADEERVKALGGLHVIGTERHEARRIDNQLRGRSGRQGDPGSSTFYLALEDDLMRRFGGSRVSDLAARLANQDDVPIALGIVSRAIANAQTQVEGYNFDIRKHLIDYDDVLNTQRNVIYEQRMRILTKPDLRDDVWAMVKSEVRERVDPLYAQAGGAGSDRGGPLPEEERLSAAMRLVYYLETIQPVTAVSEGALFPSFALQHVLSTLPIEDTPEALRAALKETFAEVLASLQRAGQQNIERLVQRSLEAEPASIERFLEAATIAYEGTELEAEETGQELDARNAAQAVSQAIGIELDARSLRDLEGRQLERALMDLVRAQAQGQVRLRLLAQVQARLSVSWQAPVTLLTMDVSTTEGAEELLATILDGVTAALAPQQAGLLREIEADVEANIRGPGDCTRARITEFMHEARFGTRSGFDKQHRRVSRKVERLQYTSWVAEQIAGWGRDRLERAILDHLQAALQAWESAWADLELRRISSNTLAELDQETQRGLGKIFGPERLAELQTTRVVDLQDADRQVLRNYLGTRVLFNVQRQLMLDTTSRYWVEHLTAIEVLRQGVGLQSYAQKDPLAEYRVRAYEMFQDLLHAIQADVVTGMFTYRPRDLSQVRVGVERGKRPTSRAEGSAAQGQQRRQRPKGQKRRKRRKRR